MKAQSHKPAPTASSPLASLLAHAARVRVGFLAVAIAALATATGCVTVVVSPPSADAGDLVTWGAGEAGVDAHGWTASVEPSSNAVIETDACTALVDCCLADDSGDLYCDDITSNCEVAFQLELDYGYCSGYTYTGFAVEYLSPTTIVLPPRG